MSGCGADLGGFLSSPTPELMKSWYDLGFLYVFFRGHSAFNTIRREPWLFNDDVKDSIIDSGGELFTGVYKGYNCIRDMLKNKIFRTIMTNLKFFIEIGTKTIYSKEYEKEMRNYIDWLISNTKEGKEILKTRAQMANVVDLLVSLLSNVTLRMILLDDENAVSDGFDYKFNIIKQGVYNIN